MVTKEQAQVIGEALIGQERSEERERKNAAARPVHFMYRFSELASFEAWERPVVVAEAVKSAMRMKSVLFVWALSAAAALALAYIGTSGRHGMAPVFVWLAVAAILAPQYFYRREVIRKYVRERARLHRQCRNEKAAGDGSK